MPSSTSPSKSAHCARKPVARGVGLEGLAVEAADSPRLEGDPEGSVTVFGEVPNVPGGEPFRGVEELEVVAIVASEAPKSAEVESAAAGFQDGEHGGGEVLDLAEPMKAAVLVDREAEPAPDPEASLPVFHERGDPAVGKLRGVARIEHVAKALGIRPIGFIRSYAYAATDPFDQLLQGPVFALPTALERAKVKLEDIGVIEMHEAFAAQVLSNIQWLGSKKIAQERLGRSEPVGEIDPEKINRTGGSIALGHPFGATGARIVTTVCNELQRTGEPYGLLTVCAAGGMGVAMVVERE